MFDDLFNHLKEFIGSKIQEVGSELEKRFDVPEPTGSFVLIRQFTFGDSTISKGGIAMLGDYWQIEAYEDSDRRLITTTEPLRNVILFEVAEPNVQECVLACRFHAKALNTEKPINVSLGTRRQGQWGTTTSLLSKGISPTEDFESYEVRAYFKKETNSAKVQISVQFESSGVLQIRDIELLQAPTRAQSQ
ncbi:MULTISPECIES: hypothetical protein [Nostocales]|uniref:Uncharacterized protein n=3 Tax=Nostocales TaxID=1161 RepID=A0A0C1NDS3_9CYAN|nr:hypothetical protein [Tolypothrix bouteillei]KAF3888141.1 hypothetical protein DA73_0400023585 [Tolypothrix bouteillei VB521301]